MFDATYRHEHKTPFDIIYFLAFLAAIIIGAVLINTFIFRSFNVIGPSMEPTLQQNDRLIVNKVPLTWAHLQGKDWLPERGQVIIFKNPALVASRLDEYIVKRVIGLPGEHIVVHNGTVTAYNRDHPGGFQPDAALHGPQSPTSGEVDETVPDGHIFVCGDNRIGMHSLDSRDGLGTIPLNDAEGQVTFRMYPFSRLRGF